MEMMKIKNKKIGTIGNQTLVYYQRILNCIINVS
jgi:hypothetical protein